jgi:hypothetical protein
LTIDAVADCSCAGCRNYRAAWKPDSFEPGLLAACAEIGIDPSKALETTAQYFHADLLVYTGQLPFFGQVSEAKPVKSGYYPWFFGIAFGSAGFAEGLVCIEFIVNLPWVLVEANTYARE